MSTTMGSKYDAFQGCDKLKKEDRDVYHFELPSNGDFHNKNNANILCAKLIVLHVRIELTTSGL